MNRNRLLVKSKLVHGALPCWRVDCEGERWMVEARGRGARGRGFAREEVGEGGGEGRRCVWGSLPWDVSANRATLL